MTEVIDGCQYLSANAMQWQPRCGEMRQAMTTPIYHPVGIRIRAARTLAGISSPKALAETIGGRGLGATKLYAIEQGRQPVSYREIVDIADATGLPVEFFTADFSRLDEISENPRTVLARETAEAGQRSAERLADTPASTRSLRGANRKP